MTLLQQWSILRAGTHYLHFNWTSAHMEKGVLKTNTYTSTQMSAEKFEDTQTEAPFFFFKECHGIFEFYDFTCTHVIPPQFAASQLHEQNQRLLSATWATAHYSTCPSFSKPVWKSSGAEHIKVTHLTELEPDKALGGRTGSAIPYSPTQTAHTNSVINWPNSVSKTVLVLKPSGSHRTAHSNSHLSPSG